jgi:hypothetical protein
MTASATIPTSDLTGTISVSNGGTGASTLTGYVKGTGTTAMTASSTIPVADITGTLAVVNGGTGATTLTGYIKGTGTTAMTASATIPTSDLTGSISVSNGGTGASSLTGYVKGTGTTAMTASDTIPVADITGVLPVSKGGTGYGSDGIGTLSFDTTPDTGTALTEGQLRWNSTDKTLDLKMSGTSVTQQIGQEVLMFVNASENILNGQVVYINGSFDGVPEVGLASNDALSSKAVVGVATQDIDIGESGYVTLSGLVRGLNLGAYLSGQEVWLSSGGGFTATEPTYPLYKVRVGYVAHADSGNGSLYVIPEYFENGLVNGTGKIGYTSGSGGTITQPTSKSNGVTLNKTNGQITTSSASLAGGASVSFTLTNSKIETEDIVVMNHHSGGNLGDYIFNARTNSGSATINIRNHTNGALSDAIVISFVVIKSVTA